MMTKSYTANVYRGGLVIGSVTGTFSFWKPTLKTAPELREAAVDAYGDDVAIADFRRV